MEVTDLYKKVKQLELKTLKLVNNMFSGEYQSAFKGRGMIFAEVRPYHYGDDIRTIDWNVTARYNEPYIKLFNEEREQSVMLCVDISRSGLFGSGNQRKMDLIAEISAVLSLSAISNNDKVGMVLFTDRVEKVIPPRKGRRHVLRLIRELFTAEPQHSGTDIAAGLDYLMRIIKKRSIIVLISDFQSKPFEQAMKIAHRRHELVPIQVTDPLEYDLPKLGVLPLLDAETGETVMVNTSRAKVREDYRKRREQWQKNLEEITRKYKIDMVNVQTNASYIRPLLKFFQKRTSRM